MIYQSPKGNLFYYDGEFAWTDENTGTRLTREQLKKCRFISTLSKKFLVFFKKVDIEYFLKVRETGEGDVHILERINSGMIDSYIERLSISMIDGNVQEEEARKIAEREMKC